MTWRTKGPADGTNTCESFMTVCTVVGGAPVHLAFCMVTRGEFSPHFVRRMLRDACKTAVPSLFLMDREFFSIGVMRVFDEEGLDFLVPAVRSPPIVRMIEEHAAGERGQVSEYARGPDGREHTCSIVIVPKRDARPGAEGADRYVAFVANRRGGAAATAIAELHDGYGTRWGIETGYRCANQVMPRTRSGNIPFRMMAFFVSLPECNIWAVGRAALGDRLTLDDTATLISEEANPAARDPGRPWDPGGPSTGAHSG